MEQLEQIVAGSAAIDGRTLKQRVLRAVAGLQALGVGSGDRVAILMRNAIPQVEATLAAQHLGAYPVQINWHAGLEEVRHVLHDCGARLVVCHADFQHTVAEALPQPLPTVLVRPAPEILRAYRLDPQRCELPAGALEWESWLAAQPPSELPPATAVESIIYTSGTTGLPKGVRRFVPTAEQVQRTERMRLLMTGISERARVLVPAPLYHTAPNLFAMRAVRKASLLVLPARFDAAELLADVERHRISHLYVVPTIFVRLLALPAAVRSSFDLSSLSFVLHAGGPCAPSVKMAMLRWWGPIVHEYYGSTEAGPSTYVTGAEWLRKPGTVGRAIEGARVEVRDDAGRRLGPNEVGELVVRNDGYADFTYLNREPARQELQRGDMLATGDMGYQDADGYFFLVDRKRDLVISGGVNIYPAEIEAAIQAVDGVADCAVFGIPDEEFGEALAAIVEPLPGVDLAPAFLRDRLGSTLPRFKVPRVVEITPRLPREESGKIRKRLLREPYWAQAGRRI